jgi:hypothetical protein
MSKLPKAQWFNEDVPPDSKVIDELRRMTKEAGYKSPRTLKEERTKELLKKKKAGKKSALVRKERAGRRLKMIKRAYDQLDPKYKTQPYSKDSIDALYKQLVVLSIERDEPRPPPTEDELRSFSADIESILQLPEDIRMDALKDEFYAFEHNLPPPGKVIEINGKPVDDDAPKALLQDKKFLDEENDDAHHLPSGREGDVAKQLADARKARWNDVLRASEPLSQVSRATLTKCLRLLGIKGKRQPRRSR